MEHDPFGQSLVDYFRGNEQATLYIHNNYGEPDEMPVFWYFRAFEDMPDVEQYALSLCSGTVLDIGAGVGSHALVLQQYGLDVTAIEINTRAAEIAGQRGVKKVIHGDVFKQELGRYDTLLLLMNGIGLAGALNHVPLLLERLKNLLTPGGQVIVDSSDVAYLYDKLPVTGYYGEIQYHFSYKEERSETFSWVYVDQKIMAQLAAECGLVFQLIYEDDNDHYLARMTLAG